MTDYYPSGIPTHHDTKKHTYDWRLVKVDWTRECGENWCQEHNIATCGIFYLYDANRHVHICSLTPSLELWPMTAYTTSTLQDMSDNQRDDLFEAEYELLAYEEACSYFDVHTVVKCVSKPVSQIPEQEQDESEKDYYNRVIEEVREHLQGNPPWWE